MALKNVELKSLSDAERFVKRERRARWDGWDIVVFVPSDRAYMHRRGVYNRNKKRWGFEYRYPVSASGAWNVAINVRN